MATNSLSGSHQQRKRRRRQRKAAAAAAAVRNKSETMKKHQDEITNARSNVNENGNIMNGSSDTDLIDRNIGNDSNIKNKASHSTIYFPVVLHTSITKIVF